MNEIYNKAIRNQIDQIMPKTKAQVADYVYEDFSTLDDMKPQTNPNLETTEPIDFKFDNGKIRVSLLKRFGLALLAVAELTTKGAEKYEDHSWTTVKNGISRYDDALLGHYLREAFEPLDPEMLVPHEVATAWNALTKLQLLIEKDETWRVRLMARNMEIT